MGSANQSLACVRPHPPEETLWNRKWRLVRWEQVRCVQMLLLLPLKLPLSPLQ